MREAEEYGLWRAGLEVFRREEGWGPTKPWAGVQGDACGQVSYDGVWGVAAALGRVGEDQGTCRGGIGHAFIAR